MVETSKNGPVVLHSFLNPHSSRKQSEAEKQGDGGKNGSGAPGSVGGIAGHVLDQTREALRPLSGSTMENEQFDAHNARSTNKDKAAHEDDDAVSPGDFGPETLANGQLAVNGMDMSKGKDVQVYDGDMLAEHRPPPSTSVAAAVEDGEEDEEGQLAPLLIATVVAPVNDSEARRAVVGLERLGREFQRRFREQRSAENQKERDIEDDGTVDG